MFPINDYGEFQRRQAELLKQAEIGRLLREAENDGPGKLRLPRQGAFWLGMHLVRWGEKLEQFGSSEKRLAPAR